MVPDSLRITEIFYSLQGETSRMGWPTVFIRLTGCPLRCTYCDSAYAFKGGEAWTIAAILEKVAEYPTPYVCVTGGEPLAQKSVHALLTLLCDRGYSVSLETGGALSVASVDSRVSRIVDIKTPGSGELAKMDWSNLEHVRHQDEIKFVLCDRSDYEWAREQVRNLNLPERAPVLFSPVWQTLPPRDLAEWVLADRLQVRVQVQLHKILWGDQPGV